MIKGSVHRGTAMAIDPVSVTIGAVATLVAVLTFRNTINRQQVLLQVTPAPGWTTPQGDPCVCVEVVNHSSFAVTISEIGLNRDDSRRYSILDRPLTNGRPLPQRLESRESITAFFPASEIDLSVVSVGFTKTSCGKVQVGDSPGWKQLRHSSAKEKSGSVMSGR